MKPAITAFVALIALGAGAAAGFFGQEIINPKEDDTPIISKKAETEVVADEHDDSALLSRIDDLEAELRRRDLNQSKEVSKLNENITTLKDENTKLVTEKTTLEETIAAKPAATVDATKIEPSSPPAVEESDLKTEDEKVADATKTMMNRMMKRGSDAVIADLTEKLSLDSIQQENIGKIVAAASEKRAEIVSKMMTARMSGEDFDREQMRTEMTQISDDAAEEIKGELGSSQIATFDDLMEKGEIDLSGRSLMGGGMGGRSGRGSDDNSQDK